jgi:autotransporter-associated beta strand protein
MVRPPRPLVLLASVAFAVAPALHANPTEDHAAWPTDLSASDRAFSSGFESFYTGPQWFLNALSNPGATRTTSARLADMTYDRAGDRIVNEGYYVGTLANAYRLSGTDTTSAPFYGSRLEMLASPLVPDATTSIDFYWDANGGLPLTGGSGVWSGSTTSNWRDGSPTGTLRNWSNGHFAHFEGVAATVFVGGSVFPLLSIFEVTGYTLDPAGGTGLTTLGGGIVLSANVNLNLFSLTTTDRQLAIGSVSGDAGSGLTLYGAQTASGSNARILLWENDASIDVPVTISGTGTTFAGFVATATGTGITGNVTNSSGFTTLLGATAGNDLTVSGIISGTSGVRIGVTDTTPNSGRVTLTNANTYTGPTTVSGGTLLVNGNQTAAIGAVNVTNSGTVLGGTGTIAGATTINANAIILGGDGTTGTTLTVHNNLTLNSTSIIELALGPSLTHSTLARSAGTWTFDATQAFTFINLGATTGTYDNIISGLAVDPGSEGSWTITNPGFTGTFAYDGAGGIDLTLTAVPEPSTWIGAALALAAIGFTQRRKLRGLIARTA